MNKTYLFSPVGGTDPISNYNGRDGALLHICRVYKPDYVVMYMSGEIYKNHEADNRYLYCLDKLKENTGWEYEYKIIPHPELKKVHEFDYFYDEFKKIIAELFEKMDNTDTLLLNISSGTPAMKSALLVLKTLGEYPCKTIQVSTPDNKMNEHHHEGYDVEFLWEFDEDNEEGFENRCKEVFCPSLSIVKNEEIIKEHIRAYDYEAAYSVAKMLPRDYTKNYIDLLQLASRRILLDFDRVDEIDRKKQYKCVPVKDPKTRPYYEYMLVLELKLQRKEYTEFIRGITPVVLDSFIQLFRETFGINLRRYMSKGRWDREKMCRDDNGRKILNVLQNKLLEFDPHKNINSVQLVELFSSFQCEEDILNLVVNIRLVEQRLRNRAAHQIIMLDEKVIKEDTGFSGREIMNMLKKLMEKAGIVTNRMLWNSYETMNEQLIRLIGE